jgi:phosphinothricin acetyltransferase
MPDTPTIRSAVEADAAALLAIYRPFVESTAVSFETVVPTVEEFAARIAKALTGWQWLVAEQDGQCIGYAYGSSHRQRHAYRWSVEVSAYVHPNHHRRGVGRALYLRLLEELAQKGFCNAYAGTTLPNEGSVALHRAVGFEFIGVFKAVGRKFGTWHDVAWFQRILRDSPPSG